MPEDPLARPLVIVRPWESLHEMEADALVNAQVAYDQLRYGSISRRLSTFDEIISLGNGNQATRNDPRFEAIMLACARMIHGLKLTIDATSLPEDLSKLDFQILERLYIEIGAELDRRKKL